jgi:hypothetical protein
MGENKGGGWTSPRVIVELLKLVVSVLLLLVAFAGLYTGSVEVRAWVDGRVYSVAFWAENVFGVVQSVGLRIARSLGLVATFVSALVVGVLANLVANLLLPEDWVGVLWKRWRRARTRASDRVEARVGDEGAEKARPSDAESAIDGLPRVGLSILQLSLSHYERYHSGPAIVRAGQVFPELWRLPRKWEERCRGLVRAGLVSRWKPDRAGGEHQGLGISLCAGAQYG